MLLPWALESWSTCRFDTSRVTEAIYMYIYIYIFHFWIDIHLNFIFCIVGLCVKKIFPCWFLIDFHYFEKHFESVNPFQDNRCLQGLQVSTTSWNKDTRRVAVVVEPLRSCIPIDPTILGRIVIWSVRIANVWPTMRRNRPGQIATIPRFWS